MEITNATMEDRRCRRKLPIRNTPLAYLKRIQIGKNNFILILMITVCYGIKISTAKQIQQTDIEKILLEDRKRIAKEWSPLVWLHSKEVFFPSDVEYFLQNVVSSENVENLMEGNESKTNNNLPMGEESEDTYLIADIDADCRNCPLPRFLYGVKPSPIYTPPVYATINSCIDINEDYTKTLTNNTISKRKIKVDDVYVQNDVRNSNEPTTFKQLFKTINFPLDESYKQTETTENKDRFNFKTSTTNVPPDINISTYSNDDENVSTPNYKQTDKTVFTQTTKNHNFNKINIKNKPNNIETNIPSSTEIFGQQNFTVTYWMFYPYNKGKSICSTKFWGIGRVPKLLENGFCNWDYITIGNHVGDWEHISIYFQNSQPEKMYVSTHYFGAFYEYNITEHKFYYYGQDARVGPLLNVNYPNEIQMNGLQPIVYSAFGSHGLWGTAGNHIYNRKIIHLQDETDQGILWNTKKNVNILDRRDMTQMYRYDRQWLRYKGRWGNPSSNCHIGLLGFCELSKGPEGIPMKRPNFPCHDLTHSTFHPNSH